MRAQFMASSAARSLSPQGSINEIRSRMVEIIALPEGAEADEPRTLEEWDEILAWHDDDRND